jgi:hypothetical protein
VFNSLDINLLLICIPDILSSPVAHVVDPSGSAQTAPPPPASNSDTRNDFSAIIAQHTWLLNEDNEDNEPAVISEEWRSIPISQLFNFTTDLWSSRYARFAALTFEEELDLYDLLELDAEGDEVPDEARFDDTTQDILLG